MDVLRCLDFLELKMPLSLKSQNITLIISWHFLFQPVEWHCEEVDKGDECGKGKKIIQSILSSFSSLPHLPILISFYFGFLLWDNFLTIFILQNMPESLADTVGGKIFTFGSYRLGALISCIHISDMRCNCISLLRTDLGCLSNKYQHHVLHLYDPEGYTWIGLLGTTLAVGVINKVLLTHSLYICEDSL